MSREDNHSEMSLDLYRLTKSRLLHRKPDKDKFLRCHNNLDNEFLYTKNSIKHSNTNVFFKDLPAVLMLYMSVALDIGTEAP